MDLWDELEKTLEVSLQMEGDRALTTSKLIQLIQRAKRTVQANERKSALDEDAAEQYDNYGASE